MLVNASRTYHDPLHGAITLDSGVPEERLLIQLIDTPGFQRLRRIRQLGPASLTFHGAEGSRFTHSLGVMHIARRCFDRLVKRHPHLQTYRAALLAAALLHDIGHGPLSHTAEEIFATHHEAWTKRILQESQPIRTILDAYDPGLADDLVRIYNKTFPVPLIWQLVSSQLDCDRLDYLMRDSYFTGASYGKLDLDRILMAIDYEPNTQQLVVARKGQAAIEHYLFVRYFMYAQVYNHPKNLAAAWILEKITERGRSLLQGGQISADATMRAWLGPDADGLTLEHYLGGDDTVFLYHLQQWQQSQDPVLADLCRRYLDRDIFKALDISDLSEAEQTRYLDEAIQLAHRAGFLGTVYVGLRVSLSRGYTQYQKGIKLVVGDRLDEITTHSPLISALITPMRRTWLIYPREIEASLKSLSMAST